MMEIPRKPLPPSASTIYLPSLAQDGILSPTTTDTPTLMGTSEKSSVEFTRPEETVEENISPRKKAMTWPKKLNKQSQTWSTISSYGNRLGMPFYTASLWKVEMACSLLSLSAFLAIVVVLGVYDGKPPPLSSLTLNTILAFLATLTKAAFMIPVMECIGQWKWSWFRSGERPLSDLQAFDSASRGLWGSILLMIRVRLRHFVVLGAMISVIGIFTSPITQQLILHDTRSVEVLSATERALQRVTQNVYIDAGAFPHQRDINFQLLDSYLSGWRAPLDKPVKPDPPSCPSLECTYPQTSTLGVCSKAANVTHHLTTTTVPFSYDTFKWNWDAKLTADQYDNMLYTHNISTSNNISLSDFCNVVVPDPVVMTNCFGQVGKSLAFADDAALMRTRLASVFFIYTKWYPLDGEMSNVVPDNSKIDAYAADKGYLQFEAVEIIYHMCVQTHQARFRGTGTTDVVATSYEVDEERSRGQNEAVCARACIEDTNGSPCQTVCNRPDQEALEKVSWPMERPLVLKDVGSVQGRLSTGVVNGTENADGNDNDNDGSIGGDAPEKPMAPGYFQIDYRTMEILGSYIMTIGEIHAMILPGIARKIEKNFPNSAPMLELLFMINSSPIHTGRNTLELVGQVAESAANSLTNAFRGDNMFALNAYAINGTVLETETFIHIRWGWLTLIAGEVAFSVVFFVFTILATRKDQMMVLKSSVIPLLSVLDAETRAAMGAEGVEEAAKMEKRAQGIPVRFVGNDFVMAERDREGGTGDGSP